MAETELDRAEKRYAQAKARLLALKNREATKARKLDTRRKIILGGALVDLAERDSNAAAMIERLVRNLPREQDRKAFEGWDAKQPAKAVDPPAPPPAAPGSALPAPCRSGRSIWLPHEPAFVRPERSFAALPFPQPDLIILNYISSALGLLSRLSLLVVVTPILAGWFFVWMVIATGFAWFAWLIVIIILSDVPMGEALWHWFVFWPMTITGWIIGASDWSNRTGIKLWGRKAGDSHGSARFATRKERAAFEGGDGLLIGRDIETGKLLRYDGPAHLLTLAPTRAGKGVGTVIPNLLLAERSVLVIDPKGENAKIAGEARKRFGAVHILDPFGVTGMPASAYNPLGRLDAESLDLGEDAASLAEALVMDPPGQQSEAHWNEEAKALLSGLIMFAVAHEDAGSQNPRHGAGISDPAARKVPRPSGADAGQRRRRGIDRPRRQPLPWQIRPRSGLGDVLGAAPHPFPRQPPHRGRHGALGLPVLRPAA